MPVLASLVGVLRLETAGFDAPAGRARQSLRDMAAEGLNLHKVMSQISGFTIAGFALKEIYEQTSRLIGAAARAEAEELKFVRMMGDQFPAAEEDARRLAVAVGDATDNIKGMMATGAGAGRDLGLTGAQAVALAEDLTTLSYRFAKLWAIDPAEAFGLLERGALGAARGLKQYGIQIEDADVRQWALNQKWIESGEELNDVGRFLARVEMEQEAVNRLLAASPEQVTSLGESWRRFKGIAAADLHPVLQVIATDLAGILHVATAAIAAVDAAARTAGAAASRSMPPPAEPSGLPGDTGRRLDWTALALEMAPAESALGRMRDGFLDLATAERMASEEAVTVQAHLASGAPQGVNIKETPDPAKATEANKQIDAERDRELEAMFHYWDAQDRRQAEALAATAGMYADMNDYGEAWYLAQRQLIARQGQNWQELGVDAVAAQRWVAEENAKALDQMAERSDDFFDGFAAGCDRMRRDLLSAGEIGAKVAEQLRDGVVDSLWDAVTGAESFGEAMRKVGLDIAETMFKESTKALLTNAMSSLLGAPGQQQGAGGITVNPYLSPAAAGGGLGGIGSAIGAGLGALGGAAAGAGGLAVGAAGAGLGLLGQVGSGAAGLALGGGAALLGGVSNGVAGLLGGPLAFLGATVFHGGGRVGLDPVPTRSVPAALFERAPRFHAGLAPDERAGIFQVGEQILSRGEVSAAAQGTARTEALLGDIRQLLSQRQTVNARIFDRRDLVHGSDMEGSRGEAYWRYHAARNL